MKIKQIVLLALTLTASLALPSTRYIMRYTESEPFPQFLARYNLRLENTVPGRPIHAVTDPLMRDPAALIQRISDDTDDDVSIERDQTVRLPIRSFHQPQSLGLGQLLTAMGRTRPTWFYGVVAPQGVLDQHPVTLIRAHTSWRFHGLGTGLVAVIDTGVDSRHPFFAGKLEPGLDMISVSGQGSELTGLPAEILALINPTTTPLLERQLSYTSGGVAPSFEQSVRNDPRFSAIPFALGHGTMVAGAVRLVAPGARILPIRAFSQSGYGRLYHLIKAIHASEDRGANVINLSFNFYTFSPEFHQTCEDVSNRGTILVASTGNDGRIGLPSYPASNRKVTGVASIGVFRTRSYFSNAGTDIAWVGAPGEAVLLPFPGNRWAGGWGTSFSAPLVSGLAAKLLVGKPDSTYSDLQSALGRSTPLADPNLGLGGLDVWNSVSGQ